MASRKPKLGKPNLFSAWAIISLVMLLIGACGSEAPTPSQAPSANNRLTQAQIQAQTITIGDVDPDEPVKKIERFQPLADYLAERLGEFGISSGNVVVAQNTEQMGNFQINGVVDIYFDSLFPAISSQNVSGAEFILRRSKEGVSEYWSTYVVLKERMVDGFDDFLGKVIAFEEPHSTSGYVLPASKLIDDGYTLTEVSGPSAEVEEGEIGYFFSRDEENTIDLVLRGIVAAGGISNQDFDELPSAMSDKLDTFGRTVAVPRQVVLTCPQSLYQSLC